MNRIVRHKEITFEQWLEREGIDKNTVLTGSQEAQAIGPLLMGYRGGRTRRTAGKQHQLMLKYQKTQQLRKQYMNEVPEITKEVPLDLTKEGDRAYIRVQEKRKIRKENQRRQNDQTTHTGNS